MSACTGLKEPKTFEEQMEILKSRKMIIEDEENTIEILKRTNYYRLTAYALQCKSKDNTYNNISFNKMYKLYEFDKKLRHLILETLENIEISLRTYIAYNLSIKYGPEAHKCEEIFKDIDLYKGYYDEDGIYHNGLLDEIKNEERKNRNEPFVKHHIKIYDGKFPIWAVIEIFSFGMLSKMYKNLVVAEQKEISRKCFGTNNKLLESWLDTLSYIRNTCAHYGRLYNKKLPRIPKIHNKYNKFKDDLESNKLFVAILAIKELSKAINKYDIFKENLNKLINEYIDVIDLNILGFCENWEEILNL
ncbi:Abi family protein [Clostridium perfringens]|uniref:Abi family protein n=1 Tax=Clostridium perfringens TaxID=1502 RepID=UPI0036D708D9